MRPYRRNIPLAVAFGATLLIAGCDSLPSLPRIDLSGWFDGNHGSGQTASLDIVERTPNLTFRFHKLALKDSSVDAGSNAITLHFSSPVDNALIADVQRSAPDWIAGTHVADDTATIVAKKDVAFSTAPQADGFDLTLTPKLAAAPLAAPTTPVETDPLRGVEPNADTSHAVDGLQREGMLTGFGVERQTGPGTGNGL
jgi:hypothetical protein